MEKQRSMRFLTSLVEAIQRVVQDSLDFDRFVEIGGYISVEIDDVKKERYVLSELLQSSGNVVSESFSVKAFETSEHTKALSRGNSMERRPLLKRPHTAETVKGSRYDTHKVKSTVNYQRKPSNQHLSKIDQFHIPNEKESTTEIKCYVPSVFESSSNSSSKIIKCRTYIPLLHEDHQGTSIQSEYATCLPSKEADEDFDEEQATDNMDAEGCSSIEDINQSMFGTSTEGFSTFSSTTQNLIRSEDINQSMLGTSTEGFSTFSSTTQNLIRRSVKQFRIFLFMKYKKEIDLASCPPERLDSLIMEYFTEAKKKGGGEFRAKSLKCMMQRLDMFLRDVGYPHSLFRDHEFKTSREYIKKKTTTECGPRSLDYVLVNEGDVETMFRTEQLGCHNLEALTNSMWLMNSLYLRVKSPNQHVSLKWGDIVLQTDGDEEYLERYINPTFSFKLKAKPENPSRCFVNFYKQFRALRPKLAMDDEHSFYLKHTKSELHESVYLIESLPHYVLGAMWRKLQTNAILPLNKKIF